MVTFICFGLWFLLFDLRQAMAFTAGWISDRWISLASLPLPLIWVRVDRLGVLALNYLRGVPHAHT